MFFLWLVSLLGAGFGLIVLAGLQHATSAPQQAAVAAVAVAVAIIPYVAARAIEGMLTDAWRKKMLAAQNKLVAATVPPLLLGAEPPVPVAAEIFA